ncbi:MAG TPA: response regulator [Patescibacteria group bacterium]|nr:response regulator [Patescibacteria group bacterium]
MSKILLVEDDRFLIKAVYTKLTQKGFEVVLANDGDEAISKAKTEKPEIVLLDMVLPKKSGFEVLRELKGNPETASIPVFILSNLAQDQDIQEGKALGAEDYIVKSNTSLSAIVDKVANFLAAKKT